MFYAFILLFIFVGCKSGPIEISKEDMLVVQNEFNKEFYIITSSIAVSYSEYLSYEKSDNVFINDIKGFSERYKDFEKEYGVFVDKYTLSDTEEEFKVVVSALEKARLSVSKILDQTMSKKELKTREEIMALYIKETENMNLNLSIYKEYVGELIK